MDHGIYHTVICSPLDYDELAIEIFLDGNFVARINQENTIENANIEIFPAFKPLTFQYHKFLKSLECAFNRLKFFRSKKCKEGKFLENSVFPASKGTAEDSNYLGANVAEKILRDPEAYILPDGRGGRDVYNRAGQGLRIDKQKKFVCFLEPRQLVDSA